MKFNILFLLMIMAGCGVPEKTAEEEQIPTISFQDRLDSLGIVLPKPSSPVANYVNVVKTGNLLFLAGKGPKDSDGNYVTGKIGEDLTIKEGYQASRMVAISQLAVLQETLGDLNKVKRIVKVFGMVNCTSDFTNQPEVINGFSDTMVSVFGTIGKHARAAVGMASLPRGICVEIDLVVEIYE